MTLANRVLRLPDGDPGHRRSARADLAQTVPDKPRLLNLHQTAAYLGVSYWTVRDWLLTDPPILRAVQLPPLRPKEGDRARRTLRRVLLDRFDLDAFIEARKGGAW